MSLQCPRCNSPKIASLHPAMKIGALVGTVGGAARGASAALAGGVGGCALGAQLGDQLDRHVLANNLCLICGHRFNLPT